MEGSAEAVLPHPMEPLAGMRGDQVYRHVLPEDFTLVRVHKLFPSCTDVIDFISNSDLFLYCIIHVCHVKRSVYAL